MRERGGKGGLYRLQWFFSIIFIAFVIAVACFVNEAESVRESKAAENSKSNKEKVKLSENAIMKGAVQDVLKMLGRMGTGEAYYFIARTLSDIKTKTKGCLLNKDCC